MLEIKNISFSYGDKQILNGINLNIPQGSTVAFIGESGSGKSTLLKLIYGQHDLAEGEIIYNGHLILGPKFNLIPGEDYIKYLAQDFGLMPFSTVSENVGKFLSNSRKDEKQRRTSELLEMVGMLEYANVKPKFLSGGQQQRVALAKALALEPKMLLLDEPFSQIDAFNANPLRRNLFSYLKQQSITCIIATHDTNDFLPYANEVVAMCKGEIVAAGPTAFIYDNPQSRYVAALFDEVNEIPTSFFGASSNEIQLLYPHQLKLAEKGISAVVVGSYFRGSRYLMEAESEFGPLFFENDYKIETGTTINLAVKK